MGVRGLLVEVSGSGKSVGVRDVRSGLMADAAGYRGDYRSRLEMANLAYLSGAAARCGGAREARGGEHGAVKVVWIQLDRGPALWPAGGRRLARDSGMLFREPLGADAGTVLPSAAFAVLARDVVHGGAGDVA